jgi:hypothetical protein
MSGAVSAKRMGMGNRSSRRKPATVPLCSPQIPHDVGSNPGRRVGKAVRIPVRTDRQADCVELKSFYVKNRLCNVVICVARQRTQSAWALCTVKATCAGISVSGSVQAWQALGTEITVARSVYQ